MPARSCALVTSTFLATALAIAPARAGTLHPLIRSGDTDAAGTILSRFSSPLAASPARVAFTGLTSALLTRSGTSFTSVVRTGDPLPAPLSGTFDDFFDPQINDGGDIVFRATLNTESGRTGLFRYSGGTFLPITTLPTARVVNPPDINNLGDIVYEDNDDVLFLWNHSTMTSVPIVLPGDPLPGGGTVASIGDNPVINDAGVVAVEVEAVGTGDGIFTWDAVHGLVAVARGGSTSPLGLPYREFDDQAAVSINSAGQVAFTATLVGTPGSAVLRYDPAVPTVTVIAEEGDSVGSATLSGFDQEFVGVDASGHVAFEGLLPSRQLVFASGGTLTALTAALPSSARDFAPRLTAGGRIVWRLGSTVFEYDGTTTTAVASNTDTTPLGVGGAFREPSINGPGVVAFRAQRAKLELLSGGSAEPVAEPGASSPGTGNFTSIVTHVFRDHLVFGAVDAGGSLIVRDTPSSLTKIIGDGAPSPTGGTLLMEFADNLLDAKGAVVLFKAYDDGVAASGLFRATTGGTVATVAHVGDLAPGGALFADFTGVWAAGRAILFRAQLDDASEGLFLKSGTTTFALARTGGVAPPLGPGAGAYAGFGDQSDRAATSGGRVVFSADLTGGTAASALFLYR